jgi:hypothetical protein
MTVLVLAWFFHVTTPTVSLPLATAGPIATQDECNGLRLDYLHMMLAEHLTYQIEPCFSEWIEKDRMDKVRGAPDP